MSKNKELYVVDENGEILDTLESMTSYTKLAYGDKVIRKGAIQYLKESTDIKYHFIKVNPVVYDEIANKYPIVNTLLKYIGYMDGILSYKNGRYVKLKDIHKLCDVSESTVKRQIKGLTDIDVLHKRRDEILKQNYYVFNPFVAYIGKRIDMELYNEFKCSEYSSRCEEWMK